MGFFNWISDAIFDAVSFADTFITGIKNRLEDIVNTFTSSIGSSNYDSKDKTSMINMEQNLSSFREQINPQIESLEREHIAIAKSKFSQINGFLNDTFPDLKAFTLYEQNNAEQYLNGIIKANIQRFFDQNDPEFQKILSMPPGEEKINKLKSQTDMILSNAADEFNDELKIALSSLISSITERINDRIETQKQKWDQTKQTYQHLQYQLEKGALDIELIENNCCSSINAAYCVQDILERAYRL